MDKTSGVTVLFYKINLIPLFIFSLKFVLFPLWCLLSSLYVFGSLFLQSHLCASVCFMYAWEQHRGSSAPRVLVCFMLCSWLKQFRMPVASLSSGGHAVASWDVSFSCHCLCSVCVFWCPVPVSVTGVCLPVLRF